jgi:hypothetical protein
VDDEGYPTLKMKQRTAATSQNPGFPVFADPQINQFVQKAKAQGASDADIEAELKKRGVMR